MAKKSKAPYIILAVVLIVIVMASVALRLKIDNLQRRVAYLNDSLIVVQNEEIKLMAMYQELANRDSIVIWGMSSHGLIFNPQYSDSVTVNQTDIETLEKIFAD